MSHQHPGRNGATIDFRSWKRRLRPNWAAEEDLADALAAAAMDGLHARELERAEELGWSTEDGSDRHLLNLASCGDDWAAIAAYAGIPD